ncbi:tape measure protein [Lactobacillus helveticus]|uniref:tape measure protein n=1 Tax=Lactobacillus helveticus TaxID=1587 RepID=UPI001564C989|nr:tape measure protein [Lactobacillus helveticus]NRO92832.1 Chromosome partition protein Smc [Lactobacillus helveticus]
MAGNIPMGSMSTEIKLNGSQSVKTLRELKQAVAQATSAWKAQRAELSTIGKSTEAAETKYKGLAETIKKQKDYISGLQEAQKHLKNAQQSVDRTTKKGRQEYGKYNEALQKNETRLHSAEQRLAGLADQQSKAKKSLDYYKSGLAEAQKQLQLNESVTKSYVAKLSSEGKSYEAAKAKLNGYKDSIENLTKQQKIQEQELSKVASESGKSSEAYKRQQVRVNETAASLAKAKTQMTELGDSMRKANPSFLDRIKSKLTGVDKEANQTHRTFKEVFAGSFLGNALSNAVSNVTGQLKNTVSEGMALNAAVAKINARFKSMGMSAKDIRTLDKQIGNLKAQTYMTGDNVANLQTKMLNWSNIGTKGAMQMVQMIAGVGDSSKLTGNQIEQMGASLMRVGSTGKVTYSALNRVTKSAPTFMAQLAKGAGMSENKLKSLLKSGKVTQTQFQEWMAAASKYSDTAFKGFGKTQGGALKYMKVRWQKLEQTMTKPIFDAKTSGLQSLKDIMSSPELQKGAKAIGNALSATLGYLDKHKKDIAGVTSDITHIGVELAKDLWKDFADIVGDIGKSFGLVSGNSKKSQDPLHIVKDTLDGLAKNKTAIQWIAKAIELIAVAKLANAANGLFHISKIAGGSADALIGLTKGFKGVDDASKLEGTQKTFYKLADSLKNSKLASLATKAGKGIATGFHKGVEGISKATSWLGKKLLDAGKSLVSKATTLGQKIGNAITKAVKASTKFSMGKRLAVGALAGAAVATPEVMNAVKDRHSANKRSQDIGGAVGALAGGTLTSMIPVVGPMLAPVGAIIGKYAGRWGGQAVNNFTKGWQRKKPPKKFWSLENLGYSAHNMWKGFTKGVSNTIRWFKKNWKEVGLYFISPLAGAINSLYKHNKGFHKWVNGLVKGFKNAWKGVTKWWNKIWKNINSNRYVKAFQKGKFFQTALKDMESRLSAFNKWFSKKWSKAWKSFNSNRYVKAFKKGKFFSTALKDMKSRWSSFNKWLGKNWNSFWKSTQKWAKKSWNGTVKNWNGMWKSINSGWKSFKTGLGKGWRSFWKGLADFFGDIWKSIKKTASGGINGIVGIINGGISGIDNVIHSFGGKPHAISLIPKVKLATGTLGSLTPSITKPTLALLNDGHDSPETGNKETIWNTKTGALGVVNGTNVPFALQPGMEVFSASQSRDLGFTHFAKGTNPFAGIGKFFGGIGSWIGQKTNQLKKWFELATKIASHPIQALNSLMQPSSKGLNGIFVQLGNGMFDKSKGAAANWWSALWNMASSDLNGDGGPASGLLKAVETLGRGKRYLWGGYGLDSKGFDCSGLISTALEHYYHSGWGHLDVGGLWQHAHKISKSEAKPGDPVFWLPDRHVGDYGGHNMYYSAYGPNNGGPIGMQPLGPGATFGRFNGINTESNSKEPAKVKANSRLQKQIKNQVGQGFWKTLQKLADKFGEQFSGANSISGSMVEAAARKMHVNLPDGFVKDVLRVALSESGNRNIKQQIHDVNSGGNEAQGPLQFTPQTFKALAVAGHADIHNPYDELLAFFNNSDWKNSIGWTTIWGHRKFDWLHSGPQGHRRFANGGMATKPSIFGEAGPEMAIPLIPSKSTRAWELIGKAIAVLSGQSGLNQQQAQIDTKKEKEEHDFRQAMLLLLTQLVNKSNVADIKLKTPQGRTLWEVIEPFSKAESRAEMIKLRRGLSGR